MAIIKILDGYGKTSIGINLVVWKLFKDQCHKELITMGEQLHHLMIEFLESRGIEVNLPISDIEEGDDKE